MINHVPGFTIRPLNSSEKSTVIMLDATNSQTRPCKRIMSLFVDNSTIFFQRNTTNHMERGSVSVKLDACWSGHHKLQDVL